MNTPKLFVRKLSSLNPCKFVYITVEDALLLYEVYVQVSYKLVVDNRMKSHHIKSFRDYLETEI